MRVALIHYWLLTWRGGEKVLKAIADLFPGCDIYTHAYDPELTAREFPTNRIRTTFIANLPFADKLYKKYYPLMPFALEQLDLRQYDLVISSESGPAKGVVLSPHTLHVCYCHSPMRYAWDMYHDYRSQSGWFTRLSMVPIMNYLRIWDQVSAQRVDHYIANSNFVASRIHKYYRRKAQVIYPPVTVEDFNVSGGSEDFYLAVGQLVPYKRPDLMIETFNSLGKRLVIIGDGELLARLRKLAKRNVELLGWQSSSVIREYYARCRAVIFPGVEDFGIVPVEAMASGKPVIAYGRGGVTETVVHGVTGLLFSEQTVASLGDAVSEFERISTQFVPEKIRAHAEQFSLQRFRSQFINYIESVIP